jgi:hypothetical protein
MSQEGVVAGGNLTPMVGIVPTMGGIVPTMAENGAGLTVGREGSRAQATED